MWQRKEEITMTFKVYREHWACIGHRIPGHKGKCKNLHGHNYKFTFEIEGPEVDENGILVDFGDIKDTLCKWIDDNWDHKTILWKEDGLLMLLKQSESPLMYGVVQVDFCPTAEKIAEYLIRTVAPTIFNEYKGRFLMKCTVQETEKCSASYEV